LIPQPHDWDNHITIPGFFFLPLASFYKPPEDLEAFLEAGPAPVYIGFGSIVVHDPDVLTRTIFDAVKKAGVRALVSKGWGGLGHKDTQIPENIYMLDNCPHDWLFPRVSCVVHHGGAGTMAAGIAAGRPTVIVPFFGDQSFWGDMVAKAGAGPAPIPHKKLTADRLAAAITEALQPETAQKASALANSIKHEEGPEAAALSFYTCLESQEDEDQVECHGCCITMSSRASRLEGFKIVRLIDTASCIILIFPATAHATTELTSAPWVPWPQR
jgi:UDP:flavonoid glycosyltransferase YjiC (YdhE family)